MKTMNYDQFSFFETNRPVNRGHVERIKKSIQELGYIKGRPVLCNPEKKIIDGQTRFLACKELGLPIFYEIMSANGHTDDEIITGLNINQATWRLSDYIHHYAQQGVPYYVKVREFEEIFHLGPSNSLTLCTKHGRPKSSELRKGKNFTLNPLRERSARWVLAASAVPYYKSLRFVEAVKILFDRAKDADIEKVEKKLIAIPQQATSSAYLAAFQNIINSHRPERSKISLL